MRTWNKQAGPKPTKKLLMEASKYATAQTANHIAVAMAFRPNGVTQGEIVHALGHPHRNKLRQLLAEKRVKQYQLPEGTRQTRVRLVPTH